MSARRVREIGLIVLGLIQTHALAQAANPASRPSVSDLSIRVRLASEQPPPTAVQVEVLTENGLPAYQDFTHADGRVDFSLVPEGRYRLRVSGTGYETLVTEPFTILHNEHQHTEIVHIKPTSKDERTSPESVISAYDLSVPKEAQELVDKASELFANGEDDAATKALRKAIAIYPKYARAYYNLAAVLARKKDVQGAREAFEQSLQINDKFVPSMIGMARMDFAVPDLPKALQWVEKATAIEPNNLDALTTLASIQFYQGNFTDSVATVNRIHALPHRGYGEAHLIAAEVYQKQGENAKALAECALFLKEDPQSPKAEQVRRGMKVLAERR
jgi:hypothetical protein